MGFLDFLFGKKKNNSDSKETHNKKVSEFNNSVNYEFTDTLLFFNFADEKFPNHPILSKSKQSFFKIFVNNDISNLKKRYSKREGQIVMPSFFKQNFPTYERDLIDPTQKKKIKTFWKGWVYNDNFEGLCEVYRQDGNLFMRYNAVDNEVHGLRQIFDVNGNVWENSLFINGIEFGLKVLKSFDEDGFNREEMYDKNEATGTIRGYYSDGEIYFEEEYLKGEKIGIWKEWYQNGQVKWEKEYKGLLNGIYKTYHDNGNLSEEAFMENGLRNGAAKKYLYEGELILSEKWEIIDKDTSSCSDRECWNEEGETEECSSFQDLVKQIKN